MDCKKTESKKGHAISTSQFLNFSYFIGRHKIIFVKNTEGLTGTPADYVKGNIFLTNLILCTMQFISFSNDFIFSISKEKCQLQSARRMNPLFPSVVFLFLLSVTKINHGNRCPGGGVRPLVLLTIGQKMHLLKECSRQCR